jgi:DNA-binding NarL/FixJ family response regulator
LASLFKLRRRPEEVVCESDPAAVVAFATARQPEIAIVDVSMPGWSGPEAVKAIITTSPATRVIGISVYDDARFVRSMLDAGARGYILKDCGFDELCRAIDAVRNGRLYLSASLCTTDVATSPVALHRKRRVEPGTLAPREREVLQLIAEGVSMRAIAARLRISVKTVDQHRANICSKLNVHTTAALIKAAIREGLTTV